MDKENINTEESDRMIGDRLFLNTLKPVEVYTRLFKSKFFVDKSMIIGVSSGKCGIRTLS